VRRIRGGASRSAPSSDRAASELRLPARGHDITAAAVDCTERRWVLLVSLCLARDSASEGSENWGVVPASTDGSFREGRADQGRLAAAISTGVVHVFSEHTGRGPTRARTTLDAEMVVVLLHDSLTKAERALVHAGRDADVLHLRRTFQETMRDDLVGVVERLTGGTVQAYMSANHIAPDTAAEIFLMDRDVGHR
jgi:uncharacterized protein YbcI